MATEHHIADFDIRSFFQLHDLNRDGYWSREEIEAIYGVHHIYSQKKSKDDEEHQKKADHITSKVLGILDRDNDGMVSAKEFQKAGMDALPNFDDLGAEGHHYDVESEFFLHHEEQFHSTPETQTDESYNHPEDIEHFAHHEAIESSEIKKEAAYQGISVEEAVHIQEDAAKDAQRQYDEYQKKLREEAKGAREDPEGTDAGKRDPEGAGMEGMKVNRVTKPEKLDPASKFGSLNKEDRAEWGAGDEGYKAPKAPGDRIRKNAPYKYKFRRSWGDF